MLVAVQGSTRVECLFWVGTHEGIAQAVERL